MVNVLLHALLGLSVAALFGAGLRLAASLTEDTLAVTVSAAVFATAAAVAEALALGLVGLGTDPIALTLAALATWAAARATLDAPRRGPVAAAAARWTGLSPAAQVAAGAAIGAGAAWMAWCIRYPSIGFDPSIYHYTEVALWIQNGRPGSIELMNYEFPFGNYPVTNEVALAWGAGIARSFMPLALWPAVTAAILGASAWLGLRSLRVPRAVGVAATTAVMTVPWLVREVNEPLTDLPSMAWLAAAGALAAFAAREDDARLLAPALVAAGLAVGTKTTALVPVAAVTALAAWHLRARLAAAVPALGAAAIAALATGGIWYARNLVQHGSPSWPFVAGPGGDPVPPFLDALGTRFVERPLATVDGRFWEYVENLGGGPLVIVAALVVAALVRHRPVLLAATVTGIALFAWSLAPVTGLTPSPRITPPGVWSLSATRYLLPVIACAALTLALAARHEPRARTPVIAVLGAAGLWSVLESVSLGLPYVPRWTTFAAGAAAGALAAAAIARLGPVPRLPRPGVAVAAALAALAGAALAPAADGYIERFESVGESTAAGRDMSAFLRRAGIGDDDSVAVVSRFLPVSLAGDHFERPLELVPRNEPCAAVERRAQDGWLMITTPRFAQGVLGFEPIPASACLHGRRPVGTISSGSVRFFAPPGAER